MDVTGRLLRFAAGRPHPLLVPAPGATGVRLAVERECRRRGWPVAGSPAEADLLVACGHGGPALSAALDRVWEQMAAPRARTSVERESAVSAFLDAGQRALADLAGQRAAVAHRTDRSLGGAGDAGGQQGAKQDSGQGEEHGGHKHGGHQHEMAMRDGLDMAGRESDRDGLALDVLHVPLGPVLPDWPAGLVVSTTLQGDVVQRAQVEVLDPGSGSVRATPFWDEPWLRARAGDPVSRGEAARRRAAAHLDSLARLVAVAGWADAARTARRLRDDLLAGADGDRVAARFDGFARRMRRSRLLRWMTDGLGVLDVEAAGGPGIGVPPLRTGVDVTGRWTGWLDECAAALADIDDTRPLDPGIAIEGPRGRFDGDVWPSVALLDALPTLLEGTELARARVVVASLDPDPDEIVAQRASAEAAGG